MTFCPFCGLRQDIDLRQIHFRDLGQDASLPCPSCESALSVIEIETEPPMRVERCNGCHGMFFNPGKLEALLDSQTHPLVWLDNAQMNQIGEDFGFSHEVVYRKCPMCSERMSHLNFAGHSGVILDRCGTHGVWLEGGELRRLTEWWRAGGKLVFQQNEADKTKRLYQTKAPSKENNNRALDRSGPLIAGGSDGTSLSENLFDASDVFAAIVGTIVSCVTD
jgi:Zn-finger nucleic acid-binding protein